MSKINVNILGYSGALRNIASKHCVIPSSYVKTDDEISLIFSKNCSSHQAVFTFESNGIIRHNVRFIYVMMFKFSFYF